MNQPTAGARQAAGQAGRGGRGEPQHVEPPRSLRLAVRLMYAGVALTVIGTVADVIEVAAGGTAALRTGHPHATASQLHASLGALMTSVVFSGLIEAGLWMFMARANRAGLSWARIVASALFAVNTILIVVTFLGSGAATLKSFSAVTWLIGLAAVFFLWQRDSSDYFATPAAPAPPSRRG